MWLGRSGQYIYDSRNQMNGDKVAHNADREYGRTHRGGPELGGGDGYARLDYRGRHMAPGIVEGGARTGGCDVGSWDVQDWG